MFKKLNNNLLILFLFQSFALFFLFVPNISQASVAGAKKATVMVGKASGVVISSTEVLTVAHVIDVVGSNPQITLSDGRVVTGKVVKYSPYSGGKDLAVIKIPKGNYSTVKIGNYKNLKKGDSVTLFGHPRGQKDIERRDGSFTNIGNSPNGNLNFIRSSTEAIGGYSGGPAVDKNGELIGILSQNESPYGNQAYGPGWSSPINKSIIDSLPAGSGPGGPGRPPSGGGGPGGGSPGDQEGTKPGSVGDPAERKNITYKPEVPVGNMGFGDITGTSIAVYIRGLATFAIGVVGIVAAFIVMWAGFLWLAAAGSQQRISEAKTWLFGSLFGLVLALSSYLILDTINPALVEIKDITPTFKSEGIRGPSEYIGKEKEEGGEQGGSGGDMPDGSEGGDLGDNYSETHDEIKKDQEKSDKALQDCLDAGGTMEECLGNLEELEKSTDSNKELSSKEIYRKDAPAVVRIKGTEFGSGVIIDKKGHILIKKHTGKGADKVQVKLFNGTDVEASLIAESPDKDLAIYKIDNDKMKNNKFIRLGSSGSLKKGDRVHSLGHPKANKDVIQSEGEYLKTEHTEFSDNDSGDYIYSTANADPGDSGGALVDKYGKLVGIIGGGNQGNVSDSYSIPIDDVKDFINKNINK